MLVEENNMGCVVCLDCRDNTAALPLVGVNRLRNSLGRSRCFQVFFIQARKWATPPEKWHLDGEARPRLLWVKPRQRCNSWAKTSAVQIHQVCFRSLIQHRGLKAGNTSSASSLPCSLLKDSRKTSLWLFVPVSFRLPPPAAPASL